MGDLVIDLSVCPETLLKYLPYSIADLIPYILFCRQQIPFPFHELKLLLQQLNCRKVQSVKNRKFSRDADQFEQFMQSVRSVLQTSQPTEVALMIGSTIIVPSEVYHIEFPSDLLSEPLAAYSEQNINSLSKFLFGQFVSSYSTYVHNRPPRPSKIFCIFNCHDVIQMPNLQRLNFPLTNRGCHYSIRFLLPKIVHDVSTDATYPEPGICNLSGIFPLELTVDEFGEPVSQNMVQNGVAAVQFAADNKKTAPSNETNTAYRTQHENDESTADVDDCVSPVCSSIAIFQYCLASQGFLDAPSLE